MNVINTLVDNIICNYKEQYRICEIMAACAKEQLNLLQKPNQEDTAAQVMDIIERRQVLLKDLHQLDAVNKSLREQVLSELKISAFTLSRLEGKVDTEQFESLKEILNCLGNVYNAITELDLENELLMRKGLQRSRKTNHTSNKEASNAYQQIMKLQKDNP